MSVMMQDLLNTYKYGWKTSYYQNTYDYKTDPSELIDEPAHNVGWHDNQPEVHPHTLAVEDDEECEACAI